MHPPDPDTLAAHLATTPLALPGFHELEFDQLSPAGRLDAWRACERLTRTAQALLTQAFAHLDTAARREAVRPLIHR